MKAPRNLSASLAVSALAGMAIGLAANTARADVVYVDEYPNYYPPRHRFDLGFDGEGAVPLMNRRLQDGNDLTGGGGFKIRAGEEIRWPGFRLTPEGGYAYDHLFATDDAGASYAWDMHRLFGGVRVGFGHLVVPTVYGHVGIGWRDTGDPLVRSSDGFAWDTGFALDFHVVPHFGFGGHVEYAGIEAQPNTPHWLALGLQGDVAF